MNVSNIGGSDTFQYNVKAECKSHVEYILRTVKVALNLLFMMWKEVREDIAIVYRLGFLNFVIVILTISFFCTALF